MAEGGDYFDGLHAGKRRAEAVEEEAGHEPGAEPDPEVEFLQQPDDHLEDDPARDGGQPDADGDTDSTASGPEERQDREHQVVASMSELLQQQLEMFRRRWQQLDNRGDQQQAEIHQQAENIRRQERRLQNQRQPPEPEQQPDQRGRSWPVSRMMTYDGSTPWLEYEAHLDEFSKFFQWTDERKAQYLCLSLRGTAQGILLSLHPDQRSNYEAVTAALKQYFCPAEKVFVYQAELQARRLQPGEELSDLARDVRTKARLAYPEADVGTLEALMRNHFCSSLADKEMRLSVSKSHPRTLTQALAFATEYDSIMKAEVTHDSRKGKVRMTRSEESGSTADQTIQNRVAELTTAAEDDRKQMKQLIDRVKQLTERNQGQRKFRTSKADSLCYNCGEKGHFARECPHKTGQKPDEKKKSEN